MINFSDFVNEYLTIEYSPNHQALYCLINRVEDGNLHLSASKDFEKSGLLANDIVTCKIDEEQVEYFFEAKIISMKKELEGLNLIIKPISEIEEFFNLRTEKRINFKLIAFTDNNILASVKNISKSGILISTTAEYNKGDDINLKLVIEYPHTECSFSGIIVRATNSAGNKKDYGIKITQFKSNEDEEKYEEFIDKIANDLLLL